MRNIRYWDLIKEAEDRKYGKDSLSIEHKEEVKVIHRKSKKLLIRRIIIIIIIISFSTARVDQEVAIFLLIMYHYPYPMMENTRLQLQ